MCVSLEHSRICPLPYARYISGFIQRVIAQGGPLMDSCKRCGKDIAEGGAAKVTCGPTGPSFHKLCFTCKGCGAVLFLGTQAGAPAPPSGARRSVLREGEVFCSRCPFVRVMGAHQSGTAADDSNRPPLSAHLQKTMCARRMYETFSPFLCKDQFSDVRFEVGSERVPAHRFVLCARSEYWATMLAGNTSESSREGMTGVIKPDCSLAALKVVLRHVYTFEADECLMGTEVPVKVVLEVSQLAGLYALPDLKSACERYQTSRLGPDNACSMLEGAIAFGLEGLVTRSEKFILDHGDKVLCGTDFLQLRPDSLAQITASDELVVKSEMTVFNACVKFADHHAENDTIEARRLVVRNALAGIRFCEMTPAEFSVDVEKSKLLAEEDFVPCLLFLASEGKNGRLFGPCEARPGPAPPVFNIGTSTSPPVHKSGTTGRRR